MVSKVAVIAIVGILAVPILLGYALNVEQVTETDYKTTGDSVNVTPLLQNGSDYSWVVADAYQLNSNFVISSSPVIPIYNKISQTKTTTVYRQFNVPNWTGGGAPISNWMKQYDISVDYQLTSGYITALFYDNNSNTVSFTVDRVLSFHFDALTQTLYYYKYTGSYGETTSGTHQFTNLTYIDYTFNGGLTSAPLTYGYTQTGFYPNISSGYKFNFRYIGPLYVGENYENYTLKLPDYTRSALLTIDLDSITEPNYSFGIGTQCYIEKTTTDGVVSWQVKPRPRISDNTVPVTDLYYDPNASNNTYQIKIWVDPNGEPSTIIPGYNEYTQHYEFRYIGNWSTFIGEANYYKSFDVQAKLFAQTPNFNNVLFGGFSAKSPTMRVDNAEYRGMEYQVIADKTYNPAAFKTNPATTINDPVVYGPSFTFGGNTYAVKKGNITMGNHDIPVKGLVLSSVPNPNGGYDNKIGNTVISTTIAPSSITFNGKWSASISTIAQEEYEVTKTEWVAGSFAWDGIDQNFLMVGLLASVGAFIALGIYARRTRASIWPLMLVCGGAALLFFVML